MNKNFGKSLIILFSMIIVIIIIITIHILLEKNKMEEANVNIDTSMITEIPENVIQITKVEDEKRFYTVSECISNYLNGELYFVPLKINMLEGSNIDTYSVYGFVADINYQNMQYLYLIVKLDSFNSTYSVEILKNKYNSIDDVELNNNDMEIESNGTNIFSYIEIDDVFIIKNYINYYKIAALSNPELVYNNFLDTEYKSEKFEDIDDFKQYINDNKLNLLDTSIVKYSVDQFNSYKQYTILDNHNNYYIIKEKSIMDFSILLDNYTVESEDFNKEYSNASDNVKIATNIDKIFKMINNKEYKNIYEKYLNTGFKNNYFSNYQKFEDFINDKFFNYNYLGSTSFDKQNGYYVATVNYKDGISSAAESRVINMIIKLNQDNSFEFSFEM